MRRGQSRPPLLADDVVCLCACLRELNVPVDMYIEELGWYHSEFVTLFDNTRGISTHCHCSLFLLFQHLSIVLSNQNEAGDKGRRV